MKNADPLKPLRPRQYLANPRSFGRFKRVELDEVKVTAHPEAALAARWQHDIAVQARVALDIQNLTHEEFAQRMGRAHQYLADRLNGQTWMSLTDAAFVAHHLNVRVVNPPDGFERLPVDRRVEPRI